MRKTRGETELTVLFNRKQIALHFSVTQIAAHVCLSGFVGNNWEEVVGSRTGIGFRPRRPSCCSEQAPVVKQFRCGYIRREWKRWLRPKLGLEGMQEGWVNCRGELGGWITVLFGFTERNSKRKSLFTLASSDSSFIFLTRTQTFPFIFYIHTCIYVHIPTDIFIGNLRGTCICVSRVVRVSRVRAVFH